MATEKKPSKAAHSRPKSLGLMALKLTYIEISISIKRDS